MNIFQRLLTEEVKRTLSEEATVFSKDGYRFMIFPEPLGNPSFHLRYKDDWEVVLQIKDFMILENKFGFFKKNTFLPNSVIKQIKSILNEEEDEMTKWELLLQLWNNNNPSHKVNVKSYLPISQRGIYDKF